MLLHYPSFRVMLVYKASSFKLQVLSSAGPINGRGYALADEFQYCDITWHLLFLKNTPCLTHQRIPCKYVAPSLDPHLISITVALHRWLMFWLCREMTPYAIIGTTSNLPRRASALASAAKVLSDGLAYVWGWTGLSSI